MREPGTEILSVPSGMQMEVLGRAIGAAVDATEGTLVIALEGELGAGKTTLVGGILRSYGVTGPIRSPTYTLIEPYETANRSVYHLDLYRLNDPSEVEPLGIRDLLVGSALLLIEWPSRGAGAIPAADVRIDIAYPPLGTEGRRIGLTPNSLNGARVVRHIVAAIPELRQLSI